MRSSTWKRAFVLAALVLAWGDIAPASDPSLEWDLLDFSSYLGGRGNDEAQVGAVAPDGALWVAVETRSGDFPGAAVESPDEPQSQDIVLVCIDAETHRPRSTLRIGGTGFDQVVALSIDSEGHVFVAGTTNSLELSTSSSTPYTAQFGPGGRCFVACVAPDGARVLWINRFGGTAPEDRVRAMSLSRDGDPIVVGSTSSLDFPTLRAIDQERGGDPNYGYAAWQLWESSDAFVMRLRADGSGPVFSTYLGGDQHDRLESVVASPNGNLIVAGYTYSPDVIARATSFGGSDSVGGTSAYFVAEIDAEGTELRRLRVVYGSDILQVAAANNEVIVFGRDELADGLPFDRAPERSGDAEYMTFVQRLDPDTWEATGGRALREIGFAVESLSVASDGTVWLAGAGSPRESSALPGAPRPLSAGWDDAYVVALDGRELTPVFGTLLGGASRELMGFVAAGADGGAWIAGRTESLDFPCVDAFQCELRSREQISPHNAFVAHVSKGDSTRRPMPLAAAVTEAIDGHTAHLSWTPGDSTADAFAVFRTRSPASLVSIEYVDVWELVARVPATAHEWTDASLRAEQRYAYAVQPTNAAGGGAASLPMTVTTPSTLAFNVDKGLIRHRYAGYPSFRDRGQLRFRGSLRTMNGGALADVRSAGLTLVVAEAPSYTGPGVVVAVPPHSPAWRERRDGRLSWRSGRSRVRLDVNTGAFDVRVSPLRRAPVPPIEDLTEQVRIDIYGETRFQLLIGDDVGSFTPTWRKVRKDKARSR